MDRRALPVPPVAGTARAIDDGVDTLAFVYLADPLEDVFLLKVDDVGRARSLHRGNVLPPGLDRDDALGAENLRGSQTVRRDLPSKSRRSRRP
jgi:hypothetical protein